MILELSKNRQEGLKSHVTLFRQVFNYGRSICKLWYKIIKGYVQVKQTLIIGWALMGSDPLSQWTMLNILNNKKQE